MSRPVESSSAHTVGKRAGELARKQKKLTIEVSGPALSPRQWNSRAGDHPKISLEGPATADELKSLSKKGGWVEGELREVGGGLLDGFRAVRVKCG